MQATFSWKKVEETLSNLFGEDEAPAELPSFMINPSRVIVDGTDPSISFFTVSILY